MTTGYDPDLYALVHKGNPGDRRFYRDFVAGAESVLEVGAGTGRILEVLSAVAPRTVGLELDPAFATRARESAPQAHVVVGDMAELPGALGEQGAPFDRVVLPYSVLYCLPSFESQAACLQACAALLVPGGKLAWDGWGADAFHDELTEADYPQGELEDLLKVHVDGERWQVSEASQWSRSEQLVRATYLYESDRGRRHAATLRHRYLRSEEVDPLLQAAGLRLLSLSGDFTGSRFDPDAPLLVVQAGT